jgi:bacterioferritin-associated ferredoxin
MGALVHDHRLLGAFIRVEAQQPLYVTVDSLRTDGHHVGCQTTQCGKCSPGNRQVLSACRYEACQQILNFRQFVQEQHPKPTLDDDRHEVSS